MEDPMTTQTIEPRLELEQNLHLYIGCAHRA